MRDWEQLVRDRLTRGKQRAAVEPEVAEELAHHLEDVCEEGRRRGLSEEDSVERAWGEVKNWPRLARKINQARGGNEMLKQRIHRLWLPGIVTMTVAMVILYAGVMAGRQPRMMEISPKMSVFMYLAWLLILPALGALAGYWSRRAGGSVANRAGAALFTAVTMLAICSTVLTLEVRDHGINASSVFMDLISSIIGGILLPATALLIGALPFLRESAPQRQAADDDPRVGTA